ncbi:hypothetical protein [Streptomyces sp. NPDC007369]|uniref:hypothetical protein n=1 Tax=Streptomyces sp. NPDC007369 TaxID=3154589 RepID=UPI0033EA34F3
MGSPHDQVGAQSTQPKHDNGQRTFTVTVPSFDRVAGGAANAAMVPVAFARQVLPAKKGLPLYLGLGVLAAADVLEWPVAIGIGLGYAVLRRDGGLIGAPPAAPAKTERRATEAPTAPAPAAPTTAPAAEAPTGPATEAPTRPAPFTGTGTSFDGTGSIAGPQSGRMT